MAIKQKGLQQHINLNCNFVHTIVRCKTNINFNLQFCEHYCDAKQGSIGVYVGCNWDMTCHRKFRQQISSLLYSLPWKSLLHKLHLYKWVSPAFLVLLTITVTYFIKWCDFESMFLPPETGIEANALDPPTIWEECVISPSAVKDLHSCCENFAECSFHCLTAVKPLFKKNWVVWHQWGH